MIAATAKLLAQFASVWQNRERRARVHLRWLARAARVDLEVENGNFTVVVKRRQLIFLTVLQLHCRIVQKGCRVLNILAALVLPVPVTI